MPQHPATRSRVRLNLARLCCQLALATSLLSGGFLSGSLVIPAQAFKADSEADFSVFQTDQHFKPEATPGTPTHSSASSSTASALEKPFVIRETYQAQPAPPASQQAGLIGIVGLDMQIQAGQYPLIQGIFPGTPAQQQGVRVGERIVAVNGQPTFGQTSATVDAMISDVPGEVVRLRLAQGGLVREVRLMVMPIEKALPTVKANFSFLWPSE